MLCNHLPHHQTVACLTETGRWAKSRQVPPKLCMDPLAEVNACFCRLQPCSEHNRAGLRKRSCSRISSPNMKEHIGMTLGWLLVQSPNHVQLDIVGQIPEGKPRCSIHIITHAELEDLSDACRKLQNLPSREPLYDLIIHVGTDLRQQHPR